MPIVRHSPRSLAKSAVMQRIIKLARSVLKRAKFEVRRIELNRVTRRVQRIAGISNYPEQFRRYHLGCGSMLIPGYLNIDGIDQAVILEHVSGKQCLYMEFDLKIGIPAESSSLDVIYHSHFLEHLSEIEGRALLIECYRCLRSGASMRIAVPDLELWCRNYVLKNSAFFEWYRTTYLNSDSRRYDTHAAVFMGMIYNWDHKMAYDLETLNLRLREIGFREVIRSTWGHSRVIPGIELLEAADSDRRHESLVIECTK